MKYWLMKSEPSEFSIDDLQRVDYQLWDGIRNYQVRNMFRDEMKVGDKAFFYHSSCADIGVVGEMEILNPAEPDPAQFNSKSKYYDEKSTKDNPRWLGPIVKFHKKFKHLVTLAEIKNNPLFDTLPLVKKGNRLSTFPISKKHYQAILKLAK
jgi:predicted RNA-binding protein with PUA-like domain